MYKRQALQATVAPFAADDAQLRRLVALANGGDALYAGIYGGVLDMVKNNDGFAELCAALDALPTDGDRFPRRTGDLLEIYAAAHEARPRYEAVLAEAVRRAEASTAGGDGAGGGAAVVQEHGATKLKHLFRVVQ